MAMVSVPESISLESKLAIGRILTWASTMEGGSKSCRIWTYYRLPEPKGLSAAELDIIFEDGVSARNFRKVQVDAFARGNMKGEEEDARVTDAVPATSEKM